MHDNANIMVISACDTYRKLAKEIPNKNDTVLEIGCSSGKTTKELAKSACQVVAIDNSYSFIEQSQQDYADLDNVRFIYLDARDILATKELLPNPSIIFMDTGGDMHLGNVCSILRLYLLHFQPRIFVLRNFELAILYNMISKTELPPEDQRVKNIIQSKAPQVQHLLDLSHSHIINDRIFAVRKLRAFVDNELVKTRLIELLNDPNLKIRKICMQTVSADDTLTTARK